MSKPRVIGQAEVGAANTTIGYDEPSRVGLLPILLQKSVAAIREA